MSKLTLLSDLESELRRAQEKTHELLQATAARLYDCP
jgi:hypothetical protein